MKKSTEIFNDSKRSLIDQRTRVSNNIRTLDGKRVIVTRALRKLGVDKDEDLNVYISVSYSDITLNLSLRNLDSFKDSRLTAMLDKLEDLKPRHVDNSEWADYVEKTFTYRFDEYRVVLETSVRSDSPTCRRVVESIEIVEQPKYKIVCD
jgi:DNA-directed RNA polymerase beta subunit